MGTLQEEYTPSFSSFLGRGEERSCAFLTAIRAEPTAEPEHSVPPAPGAAGAEPEAPTAGEPCGTPALSDIPGIHRPEQDPQRAESSTLWVWVTQSLGTYPFSTPPLLNSGIQTWRSSLFFLLSFDIVSPSALH